MNFEEYSVFLQGPLVSRIFKNILQVCEPANSGVFRISFQVLLEQLMKTRRPTKQDLKNIYFVKIKPKDVKNL